jgi:hypothetical protein
MTIRFHLSDIEVCGGPRDTRLAWLHARQDALDARPDLGTNFLELARACANLLAHPDTPEEVKAALRDLAARVRERYAVKTPFGEDAPDLWAGDIIVRAGLRVTGPMRRALP